jgi:hypothetical protein
VTFREIEVAVPVGHCNVFSLERGSGSFGLSRTLHDLRPLPAWSSRSSRLHSLSPGPSIRQAVLLNPTISALVAFRFSFRALALQRKLLAASEEAVSFSSLGIRPLSAPPPFYLQRVHSRKPRLPSARRIQSSSLVPPSWFLTTSTVYSALGLRVCCTPLPAMEFDAFPASGFPAHPKVAWKLVTFPAPRVIPFEEFPSSAAVPHHCGRCPPAVTAHSPCPDFPTRRSSSDSIPTTEVASLESGTSTGRGPCQ